jgi:hypothetical protein
LGLNERCGNLIGSAIRQETQCLLFKELAKHAGMPEQALRRGPQSAEPVTNGLTHGHREVKGARAYEAPSVAIEYEALVCQQRFHDLNRKERRSLGRAINQLGDFRVKSALRQTLGKKPRCLFQREAPEDQTFQPAIFLH